MRRVGCGGREGLRGYLDDEAPTFMIEIKHDAFESLVLFSNQILNWYFHIFKRNISCLIKSVLKYQVKGMREKKRRNKKIDFLMGE